MGKTNKDYGVYDLFSDVYGAFKKSVEELKKDEKFQDALKEFKAAAYLFKDGKEYKWDSEKGETVCNCGCKCNKCGHDVKQSPEKVNETVRPTIAETLKEKFKIVSEGEVEALQKKYSEEIVSYVLDNLRPYTEGGKTFVIYNGTAGTYKNAIFGMAIDDNDLIHKIRVVFLGTYHDGMTADGLIEDAEPCEVSVETIDFDDSEIWTNIPMTCELEDKTGFNTVGWDDQHNTFKFIVRY